MTKRSRLGRKERKPQYYRKCKKCGKVTRSIRTALWHIFNVHGKDKAK